MNHADEHWLYEMVYDEAKLGFCGCGDNVEALRLVLGLLKLHPLYEDGKREALYQLLPDEGVRYFVLYGLDRAELTEHGGSIGGAWLTEDGERLRALLDELVALPAEKADAVLEAGYSCSECPEGSPGVLGAAQGQGATT